MGGICSGRRVDNKRPISDAAVGVCAQGKRGHALCALPLSLHFTSLLLLARAHTPRGKRTTRLRCREALWCCVCMLWGALYT